MSEMMMKINIDNLKTRKNFLYYILKNGAQIKSNENSTFSMEEKIVLVNCAAGISRSSTIVIAYLMKYHGLKLREALVGVRDKRNIICPNKNFLQHLFNSL